MNLASFRQVPFRERIPVDRPTTVDFILHVDQRQGILQLLVYAPYRVTGGLQNMPL
jgi:hypothetical protein